MRYREFSPPDDLTAVVQAAWSVEGEIGESVRIVPDACVDLIALDNGITEVLVNGPMPAAEVVTLAASQTNGLRLLPGTLTRVAGVESLADLRGKDLQIAGPASGDTPRQQLFGLARALLGAGSLVRHPEVDAVLARFASGTFAMAGCGVGPRQLQRLFAIYIGLSPRETFGILRQSLIARTLRSDDQVPLAMLAADLGFVDQAHLTRAFSRFARIPPGAYRRESSDDAFIQDLMSG